MASHVYSIILLYITPVRIQYRRSSVFIVSMIWLHYSQSAFSISDDDITENYSVISVHSLLLVHALYLGNSLNTNILHWIGTAIIIF